MLLKKKKNGLLSTAHLLGDPDWQIENSTDSYKESYKGKKCFCT